ncbi:MAG: cupin domain-containing protein [Christensenellales bacterium]
MITRKSEQKTELREHMRGGEGVVRLDALASSLPPHMRLFSKITLVPGASIGYHVHERETELFYFISGTGRVRDDDASYEVSAGDVLSTGGGHGHAVANTGDKDLVLLAAIVQE